MDNFWYLFAGYTIIWLVLFGYVLVLNGRQKKIQKEIELLQAGKK